jgi:integrase
MKNSAYLSKSRHGVFYARFLIPLKFRKCNDNLGREVRVSLETRTPKEARQRCRTLHFLMDQWKLTGAMRQEHPLPMLRNAMAKIRKALLPDVLQWNLVPLPSGLYSAENIRPGEALEAAQTIRDLNAEIKLSAALLSLTSDDELIDPSKLATDAALPISKHVNDWVQNTKDRPTGHKLTAKTLATRIARLKVFIDYFDDKAIGTLTAAKVQEFETKLSFYPARKDVIGILPNMSVKEAMKVMQSSEVKTKNGDVVHGLSESSRGHYMGDVRQFLKFAISRLVVHPSVADINANTVASASGKKKRDVFSPKDLKTIFEHKYFHQHCYRHPYQYWIPVLALFTGARITEIAQLMSSDIYLQDGYWMFDVVDTPDKDEQTNDKHLKNKTSRRKFPVHPTLLTLGFIDFVQKLKDGNINELFNVKKDGRDGAGQRPSRWFNAEFLRPIAGISDPKKVFHSFRHTVITDVGNKVANAKQDPNVLRRIVGHSVAHEITNARGNDTHYDYLKEYEPKVQMEVLNMIDWQIQFAPFKWPNKENQKRNSKKIQQKAATDS